MMTSSAASSSTKRRSLMCDPSSPAFHTFAAPAFWPSRCLKWHRAFVVFARSPEGALGIHVEESALRRGGRLVRELAVRLGAEQVELAHRLRRGGRWLFRVLAGGVIAHCRVLRDWRILPVVMVVI